MHTIRVRIHDVRERLLGVKVVYSTREGHRISLLRLVSIYFHYKSEWGTGSTSCP